MNNFMYVWVLSDLHCGSEVGLMPPRGRLRRGNDVSHGLNPFQRWLWRCFLDMVKNVRGELRGEKAVLILNGDLTEGVHHEREEIIGDSLNEH
ncbi:MAG: hypothetical protein NZL93_03680, partial [Chthoniobacterales bacterium]|nr:hypothetical protein [Chthoniobacterales bacterium]